MYDVLDKRPSTKTFSSSSSPKLYSTAGNSSGATPLSNAGTGGGGKGGGIRELRGFDTAAAAAASLARFVFFVFLTFIRFAVAE